LNPIRIKPTNTQSARRQPRQHDHHGPAHHTKRSRFHHPIAFNPDDAIIVTLSDAQHLWVR
jgi:hypothetical protein